jgi:lipid II:glycine glycyltransferase (peptidoglycan interpeptide bridge formation enzyme)
MQYFVQDAVQKNWNEIITSLPGSHILQSWEWGQNKHISGWESEHKIWRDSNDGVAAAAQLLTRVLLLKNIAVPLRIMYIPRGPILRDWRDTRLRSKVFSDLREIGRLKKAIFIKIDPEVEIGRGMPEDIAADNPWVLDLVADLKTSGWVPSAEQVQFRNTMLIDLLQTEDELLSTMKQKTRYNIRLAERRGVTVRPGDAADLDLLFNMYAETSIRDGFTIRNRDYYLSLWGNFITAGMAEPLLAEVEGEPVAGVIIFRFGGRAWYMYGMSRDLHREKMPNYLLQWQAMVRARLAGCDSYDLWGAPDEFVDSDPMWGVYRFKAGLGAEVLRFIGAWDFPINSFLYRSYTQLLPRLLEMMRRRGEQETRSVIDAG